VRVELVRIEILATDARDTLSVTCARRRSGFGWMATFDRALP
jgi:hypothetical protein